MTRWMLTVLGALLLFVTVAADAAALGRTQAALDGRKVASRETTLGNFVADAVRAAADADVAIVHAMAFRADARIEAGEVSEQSLRNCLAAPTSKIATLQLTPAQLGATMERALAKYPNANMAFLQISGMTVRFSGSRGKTRIESILLDGESQPLDLSDSRTLTVAMPSQLALGAVGYVLVFVDDVTKTMKMSEVTMLSAIGQEFERRGGTVRVDIESRLHDLDAPGQ